MARENVEIVRRLLADDLPGLYRMMSVTASDFVWDTTTFDGMPDPGVAHGLDAFIAWLQHWVEPYDEWRIDVEEIVDAGANRVVAVVRQVGRLHDSESWVDMHYGLVYSLENGKIRRAAAYATPEEARAAVGLSE